MVKDMLESRRKCRKIPNSQQQLKLNKVRVTGTSLFEKKKQSLIFVLKNKTHNQ